MRLIDADVLKKDLTRFYDNEVTAKQLIDEQPTIEPQPEPEEFEWCNTCKEYGQDKHCCHRWTKVIRETVEELKQAQPEQRWIPTSERLPEEDGQYLITVKYKHVDGYDDIYAEHGEWSDGKWDMSFGHCGEVEGITAWMPLPQPWEGGDIMTNSEAIEVLKANYPDPCFELLREAVDTAIYALSAQPIVFCKDCGYGEKLPDTIRCEYNDYLPFNYNDFCSHGVKRINGGKDE